MVPLRIDAYDTCPPPAFPKTPPMLVLKDVTAVEPRRKSRMRRSPWSRFENVLIGAALAAALLFLFFNSALALVHSVQQSYSSTALPPVVMISKTVARGDTLAKFASRYGNPGTYILEREDQIARANPLLGTTPLVPGQRLQIPVTNPAVIARIVRAAPQHLVASR